MRLQPDGSRLLVSFTRWDDLSDSLIVWKPDLPPLYTDGDWDSGLTVEEEEAAAEENWRLSAWIDGAELPMFYGNDQLIDFFDHPGVSWKIRVEQQPFLAALASSRELQIRREAEVVLSFTLKGGAKVARKIGACVDKEIR